MGDNVTLGTIQERDEQREEQWNRVNDKDWLLAEKRGYKNKDEYLKPGADLIIQAAVEVKPDNRIKTAAEFSEQLRMLID